MFKKFLNFTLAAMIISSVGFAQDKAETVPNSWNVDVTHSSVSFKVRHMVISKVKGNFDEFEGTIIFPKDNLEAGSVNFTVNMGSIDTDNEKRDEHLKSPDFFDTEKYPKMTFVSTKVIKKSDSQYQVVGDMTIKDVTKEVTFDFELNGITKDPWGGTRAGFSATGEINRQDFNITWSKVMETGGLMVSDKVEIELELELVAG